MTMLDAQQLATFEDQGFLFFPSLFSPEETAVLRAGAARAIARSGPEVVCEPESDAVRLVYGAHRFEEAFVGWGGLRD